MQCFNGFYLAHSFYYCFQTLFLHNCGNIVYAEVAQLIRESEIKQIQKIHRKCKILIQHF